MLVRLCTLMKVVMLTLLLTVSLYAENGTEGQGPDQKYKKTFGFAVEPVSLLGVGPNLRFEYSGLGAIAFFGGVLYGTPYGLVISTVEDDYDINLDMYGADLGFKYYLCYEQAYHDTYFVGARYSYRYIGAEEKNNSANDMSLSANSAILLGGRRWQWDCLYLELSLGLVYTSALLERNNDYNKKDTDAFYDYVEGFGLALEFYAGVAF